MSLDGVDSQPPAPVEQASAPEKLSPDKVVCKSAEFLIKLCDVTSEKAEITACLRAVLKSGLNDAVVKEADVVFSADLKSDTTTLGDLRLKVPPSAGISSRHEFCLEDKTPLSDATLFSQYLGFLDEQYDQGNATRPFLYLRYKKRRSQARRFNDGATAKSTLDKSSGYGYKDDTKIRRSDIVLDESALALDSIKDRLIDSEIANISQGFKVDYDGVKLPGELDENGWHLILSNCNAFHGWYLDEVTNETKIASRPAFRIRPGLNIPLPDGWSASHTKSEEAQTNGVGSTSQSKTGLVEGKGKQPPKKGLDERANARPKTEYEGLAIPRFLTLDKATITIDCVDNARHRSSVENNFNRNIFEGNISAGYGGWGAAAAGGRDSSTQTGKGETAKTLERVMIGKYMLPRATVFLDPEDLVATDELIDYATAIKEKKDSNLLRDFYKKFGQIFAHEITIGGMLTSARTIRVDDTKTENQEKEDFRWAIGFSVTAPIVPTVTGNISNTTSKQSDSVSTDRNAKDRIVFDAVGGESILAFCPQQWCASVSKSINWRIIERSNVQRIAESMSQCATKDLLQAPNWFANTKPPPVGNEICIPPSREIYSQFRVRHNLEGGNTRYLIHDIALPVSIKHNGKPLMKPERFQGPVLREYEAGWQPGYTTWIITSREGDKLIDGSKVTIRANQKLHNWFLTIMRTREGVFVPCISTSGHEPIWTIHNSNNVGANGLSPPPSASAQKLEQRGQEQVQKQQQPLQETGHVCFTFEFEDNHRGFWDFSKNENGHRRRDYPRRTNSRLVLAQVAAGFSTKNETVAGSLSNFLFMVDEEKEDGQDYRQLSIDGVKVDMRITEFNLDILASDGTDEKNDIILKSAEDIEKLLNVNKEK